jgi:hypothetical protein
MLVGCLKLCCLPRRRKSLSGNSSVPWTRSLRKGCDGLDAADRLVSERAQSVRVFVTEFSGGATPHRSGVWLRARALMWGSRKPGLGGGSGTPPPGTHSVCRMYVVPGPRDGRVRPDPGSHPGRPVSVSGPPPGRRPGGGGGGGGGSSGGIDQDLNPKTPDKARQAVLALPLAVHTSHAARPNAPGRTIKAATRSSPGRLLHALSARRRKARAIDVNLNADKHHRARRQSCSWTCTPCRRRVARSARRVHPHRSSALDGAAAALTVTPGRGVAVSLSWSWSHQPQGRARVSGCTVALRDTLIRTPYLP